ncbi:hypothetical protein [Paenibacillus sp. GCM10012306]|uniref:hypothetical protein n=1 Tax=Paenibacillus sp. GCM10012306 TaxID=3317342 RepID=UPI003622C3AE
MTNETPIEEENNKQPEMSEEDWTELLKAVHHNSLVALRMKFQDVEGQVLNMEAYGPVFVYNVKDESGNGYSCGFFLRELVARFQSGNKPEVWLASFFYEMMKTPGGKALPKPPESEDEAKAVIDNVLVPHCIAAVQEEFAPQQVHAGLAWSQEHGPMFETGFPEITEGSNVCAIPLHVLLTHLQLNRDPAELLVQGLYHIRKEHGLD